MKKLTLKELAELTQSEYEGDPHRELTGFSSIEEAAANQVTFLMKSHPQSLSQSQAGAIFIKSEFERVPGKNYLFHSRPEEAFEIAVAVFAGDEEEESGFKGIHSTAVIHPSATIAEGVTIGPFSVIDREVRLGKDCRIDSHVFIGPKVCLGDDCRVYPHASILFRTKIGSRVTIHSGAVLGKTGFGYRQTADLKHFRHKHYGNVIVEDDVEIGANTTVDRGRYGPTRIGRGTKIDNQVQVAHNVQIGDDNIMAAQTGIAGSSKTGRFVIMGGKVAVNDHIQIVDQVFLAACSAVSKPLKKSGTYSGVPAVPIGEHNRRFIHLRNIEKLVERVERLEKACS